MILLLLLSAGVEFRLSDDNYRQMEGPNALMPVSIEKIVGGLANPIIFRVTPLTVQEAEARGITIFIRPPNHHNSPSIAGINYQCPRIIIVLLPQIKQTLMQLLLM